MLDHNITPSEFQKVIDFLHGTQVPSEFFRSNLLFMLEKHFDYSVSSLWLVNDEHEMYDPISYNLDRRVIKSYQDYYYRFDPFHPTYMTDSQLKSKPVLTLDDIPLTHYPEKDSPDNPYFSFLSDEFKISQDVILSFRVGAREYGSAALFTKHSQSANKLMFINCLNVITPFVAQMLCQNLQQLHLKFRTETLESVVCSLDDGLLMFDGGGSVLYYNPQAVRFLQDMSGKAFSADVLHEFVHSLLPAVYRSGDRMEINELATGYSAVVVHSQEQARHVYTARITPRREQPRPDGGMDAFELSAREREVARLISQGKTNREIAELLYVSVPTVKTHVSNIFQKVGVNNRTSLINALRGEK